MNRTFRGGQPAGSDLEIDSSEPHELRDFLAGDSVEVQADPVFKERLRQRLWRIVRMRSAAIGDSPRSSAPGESSGDDEDRR